MSSYTTQLPICQETQDTVNVAERVLPISAPVPVWCASLGRDALRSILGGTRVIYKTAGHILNCFFFFRTENTAEETQAHTFDEPNETTEHPQGQWSINRAYEENGRATGPKMIIRPITPSTLMALTEPCLMGWCFSDAEENPDPNNNNNGFGGEASPDPEQTPDHLTEECYDTHSQTGRMTNEWGY